jgi:hypothetical protein
VARRVKDTPIAVHEISAGRLSDSIRDTDYVRPIDVHKVLLIAGPSITRALKDQAPAVVTEVGFGVLATVRELSDVAEMRFPRFWCEKGRVD